VIVRDAAAKGTIIAPIAERRAGFTV